MTTRASEFDELLRGFLPYLGADPLDGDVPLAELGLDSLNTMNLLVEVEDRFDVRFPDETLTPATFASANTLWRVVCALASGREVV